MVQNISEDDILEAQDEVGSFHGPALMKDMKNSSAALMMTSFYRGTTTIGNIIAEEEDEDS